MPKPGSSTTPPESLSEIIQLVPGYDPVATAGNCWFNAEAAQLAIDFFGECLTFTKGRKAKQPFLLEPWQQAIVANIYGWKRPDGTRRYREVLIFVPRKNGKTELTAGIVNKSLYTDGEPGAECYSAAADEKQATICFTAARTMILQDPDLLARAEIYKRSIVVGDSSYQPVTKMPETKHGFSAHLVVNDELHAQPSRELTDVMMTSTASRDQPLVLHLSTSDFEREGSICNEKHDYASKVRDGVIDDAAFLPVIYEAGPDDDWKDPATWRKANPNLGVSISEEYLDRECKRAQESPSYENTFKRLHLNIRTSAVSRWITSESWEACGEHVELADFAGQGCWAGLDLASTQDFTAFVLLFEREGDYYVFANFWVPCETARRRERKSRIPYAQWEREGHLQFTPGRVTDYDAVRAGINQTISQHDLQLTLIAADRLFQGLDICRRLAEDDGYDLFEHGQGFLGMALPAKETERLLLAGRLHHDHNPILRWMASNTIVEEDAAGNKKPSRQKSSEKIDGIVAMVMAVGASLAEPDDGTSGYDEEGIFFL